MAFVLGIDFGGTKIAVGSATPDGELIESRRIETRAEQGAEQAVERAIALGCELTELTRAAGHGERVGSAAVSPGIVRPDRILLAPNVPGWDRLHLPDLLAHGLGAPAVAVANDVNAAALAETRWGSLRDVDAGLFVSLGTGIKAGLVVGGRVFSGANGAAGEIGYSLRDPADASGFGSGHAPLEEFLGGRALGERASALLGKPVSAAQAFGHPGLPAQFAEDWLRELTMHIANLAIAFDPQRIALGGGLMAHAAEIMPGLRSRVDAAVPFPPEIVAARFVDDGALRGAVALAIDTANALTESAA